MIYGELVQEVTSKKKDFSEGDIVQVRVWRDVIIDGQVVVKAGSPMLAEISELKKAKFAGIKGKLKIRAKSTAGASLDPSHPAVKSMIDRAADAGEDHTHFGFRIEPKEGDPRKVENRLYFDADRKPTRVEIEVVTRRIDGSPTEPQVAVFDWPE